MKLRIRGNSIRLRLTQTEVAHLAAGESVREICRLTPLDHFSILLQTWNLSVFQVKKDKDTLHISVPESLVLSWSVNQEEGFYGTQNNGTEDPLRIAVEKDFSCLTVGAGEDESDNYPNPEKDTRAC